ncbi:MAG: hypothetical protein LBE05_05895 [Microbacterium sp.]|jgi:hypothetical protein|nr:hypothetical protein [Microbacterium sp.]
MTEPILIVPEDAPREVWHAERGVGFTASRAYAIARGGTSTWRRELETQMNGTGGRGTAAMQAGTHREAALLDLARGVDPTIRPNSALWAAGKNRLIRATPDGIGADCVVEVKSHDHKWNQTSIPPEHLAQMLIQGYVMHKRYALYGFEVRDEDDQPPLDGPTWIRVDLTDHLSMLSWLLYRGKQYIAWREAGCPVVSDMRPELAEATAAWVAAKLAADAATAAEKKAAADLKRAAKDEPFAAEFGAIAMGETGGFQLTVTHRTTLDLADWEANDPFGFDRRERLREMLAGLDADALTRYPKTTTTDTLRFQEAPRD